VCLLRLRLGLGRAFARVLDRQRGRDHHHLADTGVLVRLDDHPCEPRVERDLGELAADRGEPAVPLARLSGFDRTELGEQLQAVGDAALVRLVDERERGDVAESDRGHLQDDGRQVRPQDLRVGELRPALEVFLGVQPDADSVAGPAAAALALVGARLRDRLDRQVLDLGAMAVARDPRRTGVDHVLDAGNGQRGLRHVGREDDPATPVRLEDPMLLGVREPCVQR
jgi:hypothetical protein